MKANPYAKGRVITHLQNITPDATIALQPRAFGRVRLSSKQRGARSVIDASFQTGSLKMLFPRSGDDALQMVLLNTAGGITGGDDMRAELQAGANTQLTVTTQACERAYRAQSGQIGHLHTHLRAAEGARLNWLPQETILFEGCALERRLQVELDETASFLMVEPVVFGRTACGERLHSALFRDRIDIRRAGRPLYLDQMRFEGDIAAQLDRPFVADGAQAMASVVLAGAAAELRLDALRALLPESAGASLLAPDLLVCRLLASDAYELRKSLLPLLGLLTQDQIPRCWMI